MSSGTHTTAYFKFDTYFISMRLLGKRTFAFANVDIKNISKQHASSSSPWQCTENQQLPSSTTMGEPNCQEPPDLSAWTTDQLIARVTLLEQQLKEQSAMCVHAGGPLETVLIA